MKKKLISSFIFFIGLLLFFTNTSFCADYTESNLYGSYKFTIPDNVLKFIYSTEEYSSSGTTYGWFVIRNNNTDCYELYYTLWSQGTPIQAYLTYNKWHFNGSFTYIKYSCPISADDYSLSSNWTRTTGTISNQDLYTYKDSNTNSFYAWSWDYSVYFYFIQNNGGWINFPMPVFNTPPHLKGWNDEGNYLESGEFDNFVVTAGDYTNVTFVLLDNTYSYQGAEGQVLTYEIDLVARNGSQYYQSAFNKWVIPKDDIPIPYMNKHIYEVDLIYDDPVQSQVYEWSTDFSAQVIADMQEKAQTGISNIEGILNNNNYSQSDIVNSIPSSSNYTDPTGEGFNQIFASFYNAFTTSETQTVRFVIPFSEGQYIDIPANLVTSRIPQVILVLIQGFYWFIICRYIVKDIAKTVHNARTGEILEKGADDGNIKTELM